MCWLIMVAFLVVCPQLPKQLGCTSDKTRSNFLFQSWCFELLDQIPKLHSSLGVDTSGPAFQVVNMSRGSRLHVVTGTAHHSREKTLCSFIMAAKAAQTLLQP